MLPFNGPPPRRGPPKGVLSGHISHFHKIWGSIRSIPMDPPKGVQFYIGGPFPFFFFFLPHGSFLHIKGFEPLFPAWKADCLALNLYMLFAFLSVGQPRAQYCHNGFGPGPNPLLAGPLVATHMVSCSLLANNPPCCQLGLSLLPFCVFFWSTFPLVAFRIYSFFCRTGQGLHGLALCAYGLIGQQSFLLPLWP